MFFAEATAPAIDPGWVAATTAVAITVGLIAQIILQIMAKAEAAKVAEAARVVAEQAKQDAKKAQAATEVAAVEASKTRIRVEEAQKELKSSNAARDEKLEDLAKVTNITHSLVNSNLLVLLRSMALTLRRVAQLNKNDPADVRAAELAEKALHDHEAAQIKADREQKVAGTDADNTLKSKATLSSPTPLSDTTSPKSKD